MTTPQNKHVVGFAYQAWGHTRPLIALAAHMVKLRPVDVTIVTTNAFYDRVNIELARHFEAGEEEYTQHSHIYRGRCLPERLSLGDGDEAFKKLFKALVSEEEVVCPRPAAIFPPLTKPQAVVLDFFAIKPFNYIQELCNNTIKVYAWESGMATAMFHMFGPESVGGRGNFRVKAEEEAQRSGRSSKEVAFEIAFQPKGEVVRVPAMPPMYDHEYLPQDFPLPEDIGYSVFPRVYETFQAMDGMLLVTPECYEPTAVAVIRSWFGETGREVHVCGPLLPATSKETAQAHGRKHVGGSSEIEEFLDTTLNSSGPKSLLYISLGTVFWPVTKPQNIWAVLDVVMELNIPFTESVWAILDVLMELNIPFILSHASPFAKIPDEVTEKATGWFIAHGGHNGVTDAIFAGVPQIVWPFSGDQPLNAVHIADQLQIGYKLLEVRSGDGLKPIYRTGYMPKGTIEAIKAEVRDVLQKAFGEDSAKRRERLEVLKKAVARQRL
ncbi:hypothetical protein GSI_03811 [Ganoderma sinense ZZ0214-1]|uniref:Glycosyltransferase family 1 protein n=1 Tax=Ganoderma sinense ZZ0214-1 TaxID=1077348 RepID=A0A2G8SK22_9APHY|nr:hypothetical protein GSI_03811 [Ganoderma sinense ZZ0214-1]